MKREGNLYGKICSLENIRLADAIAQDGKQDQYGVQIHNRNPEANILELRDMLLQKEYMTSAYSTFKIYDPKEREVSRLPYYPDRIVHHMVMNELEKIFVASFTADTYSCIKGRGIHAAAKNVEKALRNVPGTQYCLTLDVKKFYPSIDHDTLKQLLRRKFKDPDLLWLLDEIIDSAPGVPIGNYLSQYFANFYLSPVDHMIKEQLKAPCYFRYTDNLVLLASNKSFLHFALAEIRKYLSEKLKLEINRNYRVFPVASCGIDFVGYEFYHGYTLLRKSIKQRFARMLVRNWNMASIASYWGWAKHCNSNNLLKKLLYDRV